MKKKYNHLVILLFFLLGNSYHLCAQHETNASEIDSLVALAMTAQKERRLKDAYDIAAEAKEKCERSIGKLTPQYAQCLHTMGVYFLANSRQKEALPLTLEALEIRRQLFGNQNNEYGNTLNNLVVIYFDMGLYEKAKPLAEESLAIKERIYGPQHPETASGLINLAKVYTGLNGLQRSNELLEKALAIRESHFGPTHPSMLSIIMLLGSNHTVLRNGKEAVYYTEKALALMEQILHGNPDPSFPMLMGNLAVAYAMDGQYDKELALQPRIDSLLDLVLPRSHPLWATRYNNYSRAYRRNGIIKEAVDMALKAQEANAAQNRDKAIWMSGEDLYEQLQQQNNMLHEIFSLAADHAAEYPELAAACYNDALLYKGMGLSSQRYFERELSRNNTVASKDVQEWKNLRKAITDAHADRYTNTDELASMKNKAALLENRLLAEVGGFTGLLYQPKWQDVLAALGPGEAAVELLRYSHFKPEDMTTTDTRYLALILRHGRQAPVMVPICSESDLLLLLPTDSIWQEQYLHDLYQGVVGKENKSLADLVWSPLAPYLEGVSSVYYSPAGALHRINLGALVPDGKTPLNERFHLRLLLSTRTLAEPMESIAPKDALLIGGIHYDADSTAIKNALNVLTAETGHNYAGEGSGANRGAETRGTGKWRYLRASEKEVADIQKILQKSGLSKVEKRTGTHACEELFLAFGKGKAAPGILHIATHGFALPAASGPNTGQQMNAPANAFASSYVSMNRTGMVFAGANHTWLGNAPYNGLEDGILTAQEISGLDFSKTELAVLSACESGLGEIRGAEGVLGLQGAFKIAGARYIILSLWQVPDQETQEFMVLFYKKWLEEKMPVPEAFRATQMAMRRLYSSPYYWAGFVLLE